VGEEAGWEAEGYAIGFLAAVTAGVFVAERSAGRGFAGSG